MKFLSLSVLVLLSLGLNARAASIPAERPSADLVRTNALPASLEASLSANVFRTEEYEAPYTVEVPYEAQESYYESVPYQSQEQVCHDDVSWRQDCRMEQVCGRVTGFGKLGSFLAKLDGVLCPAAHADPAYGGGIGGAAGSPSAPPSGPAYNPGGGGIGGAAGSPSAPPSGPAYNPGGGGIGGGGGWGGGGGYSPPPPSCHMEQRCFQVPVHHQNCHWEMVTRYRQELRYRTVTRYRTETRCCVTKTRQVYDHQLTAKVTLVFPAEATLTPAERETFRVILGDDGQIKVAARQAIYTYVPAISADGDGKYVAQMNLAPTYQPEDLAEKTISKLKIAVVGNHLRLSFTDAGAANKTRTRYDLQLIDGATGNPLIQEQKDNAANAQRVLWDLNVALAAGKTVTVRLAVARDGIVIARPMQFNLDANLSVQKEAAYDASPYTKESNIHHYRIAGKNAGIVITFKDETKVIDEVSSEYRLGVFVQESRVGRLLGEKTFKREELKTDKDGNFNLSLANDFGLPAEELAKLNPGTKLGLSGEVYRYGSRFKSGKGTVAVKAKLTVPKK